MRSFFAYFDAVLGEWEFSLEVRPCYFFPFIKVGLSPSQKYVFIIYFNEIPLKVIKNAFYFMLKALFVLEIFTFLSWLFGYVEKRLDKKAMVNFKNLWRHRLVNK